MRLYTSTLNWIDNQHDEMIKLLISWASINSHSDNLLGLVNMQSALQAAFASLEAPIQIVSLPPRTSINHLGHLVEKPQGNVLLIKKRPEAPIQVLLGGHFDTVYPADCPFQLVEKPHDDTMRGPGVTDMKGGIVILLKALEALERSPYRDHIGWEVFLNSNEEVGSIGMDDILEQCAKRKQVGLLFEPAFSDGALVSSRKGSATFTVIARGRAAHAGRDFHQGKNAITALANFIVNLDPLNYQDQGITINIGQIEGGGPINIVPDLAICRLNARALSADHLLYVHKTLEELIRKEEAREGITMKLHRHSIRQPKPFDEKTGTLFASFSHCATELGFPLETRASGGVCDGNILSALGLPTLDTLGVVGGKIHTFDEYIQLSSLTQRCKLTTLFLMKLANRECTQ